MSEIRSDLLLPTQRAKYHGIDEHLLLAGAGTFRMCVGVGTHSVLPGMVLIKNSHTL